MTWSTIIEAHINLLSSCEVLGYPIEQAALLLRNSLDSGGKILICGNGGSCAHAEHFAAKLVGRFKSSRAGLSAIALGANAAVASALANDFGYPHVFVRELEAIHARDDVLIGITTSGRSSSVFEALGFAREMGLSTIALTGVHGVPAYLHVTQDIRVPSDDTARIQEVHQLIIHALCEALDA